MNKPKLYVFDIDGTLLNTDYQILPSTKEAMSLLNGGELSAPIMLASARSPRAIDPICAELDLAPFYVSLNGALIVREGRVLYDRPMEAEAAQRIMEIGREAALSVNVYSNFDWFVEEADPWSAHEGKMVGWQAEVVDFQAVRSVHKILLMGEQEEIAKAQRKIGQDVPSVSAQFSIPNYLEIVDKRASKGHALEIVSELLAVDSSSIVAFGDGENDLAMLQTAGFSIAMGNAHPSLKKAADFVTGSNDEDGILQAVQRILAAGGVKR